MRFAAPFLPVGFALAACASHHHHVAPSDDPASNVGEPPRAPLLLPDPVDDHAIAVDALNVDEKRQALIQYLWGARGFPAGLPTSIDRAIASPVPDLPNLRRVDQLRVTMQGGEQNVTHHYIAQRSNGKLVVMALGHLCSFSDRPLDPSSDDGFGQSRALAEMLNEGFSVLATFMPHLNPLECGDISHNDLMRDTLSEGHPLQWFLEPIAVSLNYLKARTATAEFPAYSSYSMIGMSGGGWTTTVYSALDPTIRTSIQIAGSIPLHLRYGNSGGDAEQSDSGFYEIAGYPDLYVLGAEGGRRQIQILNRRDDCCFGQATNEWNARSNGPWDVAMRAVEQDVQKTLRSLSRRAGSFRLEIDEVPGHHTISWNALIGTVLAELDGGVRNIGLGTTSGAFVAEDGALWQWSGGTWVATGLAVGGAPAVVDATDGGIDLFYRSPTNVLMHAFRAAGSTQFIEESLGLTVISDPAALRTSSGKLVAASVSRFYEPVVWPDGASTSVLFDTDPVVGTPAIVAAPDVQLYGRGIDRSLHIFGSDGTPRGEIDASMRGFPAAIASSSGIKIYFRDLQTDTLEESAGARVEPLSDRTGFVGSPAVSIAGQSIHVYSATAAGALVTFASSGDTWSSAPVPGRTTTPPAAIGEDVFGYARGGLWKYDGLNVAHLGRPPFP